MAQSKKNVVIHGMSGKLGGLVVFRQRFGKTLLTTAPGTRTKEQSAAQQEITNRFQKAVVYAKSVLADPAVKAEYKAAAGEGRSAYNLAIADFFNSPSILNVDVSAYTGEAGQPIMMQVTDDYKVKSVSIAIRNADDSVVEEGMAVQQANLLDWVYTTTTANPAIAGDKVVVTATDYPRNVTKFEQILG